MKTMIRVLSLIAALTGLFTSTAWGGGGTHDTLAVDLLVGETKTVSSTVSGIGHSSSTWSETTSGDDTIATLGSISGNVSPSVAITAKKEGKTTYVLTESKWGNTWTLNITVTATVASVYYDVKIAETFDHIDSYVVSNATEEIVLDSQDSGTNIYKVASNDTVRVYFTPAEHYGFVTDNPVVIPEIAADTTVDAPAVVPVGSEGLPWKVGTPVADDIRAWTNGTGVLTLEGASTVGKLADLVEDWENVKGGITAIVVENATVTNAAADAFAGITGPVALTLPDGWAGEFPAEGDGAWYGTTVNLTRMPVTIRNVAFAQRWPWNGLVDISFAMTAPENSTQRLAVTVLTNGTALAVTNLTVTVSEISALTKRITWDAADAGLGDDFRSDAVTVEIVKLTPPVALSAPTIFGARAPGGVILVTSGSFGPNQPLFVIDGVAGGSMDNVNPDDIASMQILKDASATAIYGARGANGVIVITTVHAGEVAAESATGTLDLVASVTLPAGQTSVPGVTYSADAWGYVNSDSTTIGFTNLAFGTTGALEGSLRDAGVTNVALPRLNGDYRLTHSSGDLTSFVTYTVSGFLDLAIEVAGASCAYVVSNNNEQVEAVATVDGTNHYGIAANSAVSVHFTPAEGWRFVNPSANPVVIPSITSDQTVVAPEVYELEYVALQIPQSITNVESYVVSNATVGAIIEPLDLLANEVVIYNTYRVPSNDIVRVYFTPAEGCEFADPSANPLEIDMQFGGRRLEFSDIPEVREIPPQPAIAYLDWDADAKTFVACECRHYAVLSSQTNTLAADTWYVVTNDVAIATRIQVLGTPAEPTHLILCDGVTLAANAGVGVPAGKALAIYGQSKATGTLAATAAKKLAGIGGGDGEPGGKVIINGGTVTAAGGTNGANSGAGIGGGSSSAGGEVIINGGTVTASGDNGNKAAGIGGGNGASDGTVRFGDNARFRVWAGASLSESGEMTPEAFAANHDTAYAHIEAGCLVTIPADLKGTDFTGIESYVVSNADGEVTCVRDGANNVYWVRFGDTVSVYFTLTEGRELVDPSSNKVVIADIRGDVTLGPDDIPLPELVPVTFSEGRFGICSWTWHAPIARILDETKRDGFNGMQLALAPWVLRGVQGKDTLFFGDDEEDETWRLIKQKARLGEINVMSTMINFPYEDYSSLESITNTQGYMYGVATGAVDAAEQWASNLLYTAEAARMTKELGVRYLTTESGFIAIDPELAFTRIKAVCETCSAYGVDFLIESGPHTGAILTNLMARLNAAGVTNVGINYDPGDNQLFGAEEPVVAFEAMRPWIRQVHAKDCRFERGAWNEDCPWGDGDVSKLEFAEGLTFIDYLDSVGYVGNVLLEYMSGDDTLTVLREMEIRKSAYRILGRRFCEVGIHDGSKRIGEYDPTSIATNFTLFVSDDTYTEADFAGYCVRDPGEAVGEYAINFVFTRRPDGFSAPIIVLPGVFTILDDEDIPGAGTVKYPSPVKNTEFLKEKANATWSATAADKGSVFAGWVATADAPTYVDDHLAALSENELRNPKLTFKVLEGEQIRPEDIEATWVRIDEDTINSVELRADGLFVGTRSYVTASLSGLPSGLKFDKKTLAITGTLKAKDKDYAVKATVKNASGYTWTETFTVTVSGGAVTLISHGTPVETGVSVELFCDPTMGTVKGSGVYALGKDGTKKVSISATAKSGYVFAGWYVDRGLTQPVADPLKTVVVGDVFIDKDCDYREASTRIILTEEPVRLYARFVEKTTKADPIVWLRYAGAGYCGADAGWLAETETWYQGVALPTNETACAIAFDSASLPTVTVSGLPSGVKFDKKTLRFTGVPTAASTEKKPFFAVKVSVKNKSGATDVLIKNIRVEPLPAWTVGNFDGYHMEEGATNGTFTATVGKTGKVSGKTAGGLAATTFSAASFSDVFTRDGENLIYVADVTVSYKDPDTKKTVKASDTLYLLENPETGLGAIGGGDEDGCGSVGVQRAWDRKADATIGFKAFPAFSTKPVPTLEPGNGLTLKFGAKGKVTVSGKVTGDNGSPVSVSGSTYVLPLAWTNGDTTLVAQVYVYVAPKKNLTDGVSEVYEVLLTVGTDGKFAEVELPL